MNILDWLAPPTCAFCASPLQAGESGLCAPCFADLPWADPAVFPAPGMFERRLALLDYVYPVDAAIKAMKFKRKLFYGPAFAEVLCTAQHLLPDSIDAVLPVPLHWRRKAFRGFNQAREIARPLAARLGVPLVRCLRRHKATAFQSGLDARERAGNLRRAFRLRRAVSYSHVLIVDDVLTTGATASAAARSLLHGGARAVSVITLAKASA